MHPTPFLGSRRFVAAFLTLLFLAGGLAIPQVASAVINKAPWISGTPPKNITAGSYYSFKPTSGDPNGQTLRFSIAGKPTWATFSTSTGKIYGTPPASTAGKTYSGISIRVTDGSLSATLPKFALSVVAPANSSVTLRWSAPTRNVDGTALTNLQGYRIAYGTASRSYDTWLYIAGGTVTSAVIQGLPKGQYFFAVMAVNAAGYTSGYSGEAQKWL